MSGDIENRRPFLDDGEIVGTPSIATSIATSMPEASVRTLITNAPHPAARGPVGWRGFARGVTQSFIGQASMLSLVSTDEEYEGTMKSWGFTALMFGLFTAHFLFGACVYHFVAGWPIVNALYFSAITITTVGYGDLEPESSAMMTFQIVYIFISITLISFAIGTVAANMVGDVTVSHNTLIGLAIGQILIFLLLGAAFFSAMENWSFLQALYFSTVTLSSVGYGDLVPSHPLTKSVCMLYAVIGVIMTSNVIGQVTSEIVGRKQAADRKMFYRKALTLERIIAIDLDNSGSVSELEFLLYMLEKTKLVSREDLENIQGTFRFFDKNGDGVLSIADLKLMNNQELSDVKEYSNKLSAIPKGIKPPFSGSPAAA
mmetsp:Transcript_11160/g.26982  ORF Transcript_11160/g.26982 Transcript_11160/m.26982 type:complete len:373 (-) Transcript_11160:722-1840(-)